MPNLAAALKEEISRLARKEIKSQVAKTKQAVTRSRREITALKRRLDDQARRIEKLSRQKPSANGVHDASSSSGDADFEGVRFSSRSVRAQRRRLGLSAEKYGQLIGVSGLTVYNWEQGKTRPRRSQLASLVAVRNIGKKEALRRLAAQGK